MADQSSINLSLIRCERSGLFPGVRDLIARSEVDNAESKIPLHDRLDWMEAQIESGGMLLYKVFHNEKLIGIITGCVEREYGKPVNVLIMHAVSIEQQKTPFICTLFPAIHNLVKQSGLESWSVRSLRPGMDRRLEQHGFLKVETYYKREI